jgi:NAD(P)-dependent dehydrogenase (short-subunit alcohol dehydrogenase family)
MWEIVPEDWWRTVEVNLRGTYICSRLVLPSMVDRRAGRIVNVVSNAGAHRWPYFTSYATSKAAVIKLTESLALETRPYDVTVIAAHPGLVRGGFTDMEEIGREIEAPEGSIEHRVRSWFQRQIAEGHTVSLEEAGAFLVEMGLGDVAALSGRYVAVSDDLDALLAHAERVRDENLHALKVERLS